jgi:beta-glucosidase
LKWFKIKLKPELALITIGRNAGEGDDRKIDEDFNLAQDEINMINIVSQAFHAQGKSRILVE